MQCLQLCFCFLIAIKAASALSQCNPKDNCQCFAGTQLEIQCPVDFTPKDEGFVLKIKENELHIDCYNMTAFRSDLLPNVSLDEVNMIYLRSCFPPKNFISLLDHFSINYIKELRFEGVNNVTLTKDFFKGVGNLEKLKLNVVTFLHLDEHFLDNTPNLVYLDFEKNSNFELSPNFFKNTPLLKTLSMAKNRLVRIPEDFFKNLKQLEVLFLWSNNLTFLTEETFLGLENLKTLELSGNLIGKISKNAFTNLTQLEGLNLQQNNLSIVPSNLFHKNKKLTKVYIGMNPTLQLPDFLFANFPLLQVVDLSWCKLEALPSHIFENSTSLKVLKLFENKLKDLTGSVFKGLVNLEELILQHNQLTVINEDLLKDLKNLRKIDLGYNQIKTIHFRTFYNKYKLKEINLSHNQYSAENINILEDAPNVVNLDFSYNFIKKVTDVIAPQSLLNLEKLDLSYNFITEVTLTDLQASKELKVKLDHNNIIVINFNNVWNVEGSAKSLISLSNNPIKCDCEVYELLQFLSSQKYKDTKMFEFYTEDLTCASPAEWKGQPVATLPLQNFACLSAKEYVKKCTNKWRPFDRSVIIDCSYRNFTTFPELNLTEMTSSDFDKIQMNLEGNLLKFGPDRNLTYYENITELYLSYNEIETIFWLPPSLRVLKLDNNRIRSLDYNVLQILNTSSLVNLTLDHNPWICECGAENLTNFLRQNTKIVDARNIHCSSTTNLLIQLNRNDLCHEWQFVYLVLIIVTMLFCIAVTLALYYRYQQELKIWLFAHNLCLWWVTEEELDKEKIYDAFISYSHKDEDFVTQNLLPILEGDPQPYNLCLHYRNWIPGEFITTQITNSVLESRRTLVVLSPNFLESVWGKMEFRTAHTQAMTEGRARVIIVLYGDVDVDTLDEELKSYLKTNTYVKWGDPHFWNKLKYALPHSKRNVANNNQKIVNVINSIDNKFNTVAPVTPPVLALDANGLKKHPLNFVTNQNNGHAVC